MNPIVKPLNNEAAAAMIGISPTTLRIWRCVGKGPKFTKLGETKQAGVVYSEDDVLAWLAGRKFSNTSAYSRNAKSNKQDNRPSSELSA